jgi:uncharacterized protein YbaR (Trm112 family)
MSQLSKSERTALRELANEAEKEDWVPPAKPLPDAIRETFDKEEREDIDFGESYIKNPGLLDNPVEEVPERYQELKSDLRKLENAGQLQHDVWLPYWSELTRPTSGDSDKLIPDYYEQTYLGRELGEFAELLMLEPHNPEKLRASVTVGFLEEMDLGDIQKDLDYLRTVRKHIDELIERKEKRLIQNIDEELPKMLRREAREQVKQQGHELDTSSKKYIDDLVEDFLEEYSPKEIKDDIERYVEEYDEIPESMPSHKDTIEKLAHENYGREQGLRDDIDRDLEVLSHIEVGGITGIEVINNMPDETITARNLAEEVTEDSKKAPKIFKICKQVEDMDSAEGEDELRTSPICVNDDESKLHTRKVELTPYGKLLREGIAKEGVGYRDPFQYVSEELIEQVMTTGS